jgi:hypothetical protein
MLSNGSTCTAYAEAMEALLRRLKPQAAAAPGAVVTAVGRLQANSRPGTVDLVSRSVSFVESLQALEMIAAAPGGGEVEGVGAGAGGDEGEIEVDDDEREWREWTRREWTRPGLEAASDGDGGGGGGGVTAAAAGGVERTLDLLRVGEREGKMSRFPALPDQRVHWVADAAAVSRMLAAVLPADDDYPSIMQSNPSGDPSDASDGSDAAIGALPRVVGLDAEWRPTSGTPVAVLQIATRHEVFLVDMITLMADGGGGKEQPRQPASTEPPPPTTTTTIDSASTTEAAAPDPSSSLPPSSSATPATKTTTTIVAGSVLLDEFLGELLSSASVLKLGFGFGYDLSRMQRSYPNLRSVFGPTEGLVDVKAVTLCAFPEKVKLAKAGLATVVASVLGMFIDKTEQCSDWQRRPLTASQLEYAAADAHCLTVLFDRCYNAAPEVIAAALADPSRPLAAPPPPPPSVWLHKLKSDEMTYIA